MKRPLTLSLLILSLDQLLRYFFQFTFEGRQLLFFGQNWGFTYVVNHGLWINPTISPRFMLILQIVSIVLWAIIVYYLKLYHEKYRQSIYIDLAFAWFTVGIFGNTLDRIIFGYIRDYFINPIAISNLADLSVIFLLVFLGIELFKFPKSRDLLKFRYTRK